MTTDKHVDMVDLSDQFIGTPRKVAVTDFAALILTVQVVSAVVSHPLQLRRTEPKPGTAVSVTVVSAMKGAAQALPQLMPAGLDVIVPLPTPDLLTVNV
jgi:hypothetical protein